VGSTEASIIFRAPRELPYKVCCVHAVEEDQRLDWKECGILWYLINRPQGWKLRFRDLVKRHRDGEWAVRSGLQTLEKCGYLRRYYQKNQTSGHFTGRVWIVAEYPLAAEEWREVLLRMAPELDLILGEGESHGLVSSYGETKP